jgi:hypothetical protein
MSKTSKSSTAALKVGYPQSVVSGLITRTKIIVSKASGIVGTDGVHSVARGN